MRSIMDVSMKGILLIALLHCSAEGFSNDRFTPVAVNRTRESVKFITSRIPVTVNSEKVPNRLTRGIVILPDSESDEECKDSECSHAKKVEQATFKPFPQDELTRFLAEFTRKHGRPVGSSDEVTTRLTNYEQEPYNKLEAQKEKDDYKSSWTLINSQTHKHPFDDHSGWVTLEPIPWSSSQIQKWEPNVDHKPSMPQSAEQNKPSKWYDRPWNKPHTYEYKPQPQAPSNWNKPSYQDNWASSSDIITDGKPSQFPDHHSSHHSSHHSPWQDKYRPSSEYNNHRDSSAGHSDGRWVLLSSTKGYSAPYRKGYQRALNLGQGTSVSSHRTVRLTVLPALSGTTNTTTSHGGLLEVEETSQTVDEAQREHAAKVERKRETQISSRSGSVVYPQASGPKSDKALLAALGASMVPATMAMLVPMVLGRKKRETFDNSPFPRRP